MHDCLQHINGSTIEGRLAVGAGGVRNTGGFKLQGQALLEHPQMHPQHCCASQSVVFCLQHYACLGMHTHWLLIALQGCWELFTNLRN
jgi:hypothetical protein